MTTLFDPKERQMEKIRDLKETQMKNDRLVANKAQTRKQLTFTLVEQDRSMAKTIAYWILENIETAPVEKLYGALESAMVARECTSKKNAD